MRRKPVSAMQRLYVIRNKEKKCLERGISMAKGKINGFFCRNAVMNLQNGWGSARRAGRGIPMVEGRPKPASSVTAEAVCSSGFADGGTGEIRVGAQAKPVSLDEIELSITDRTRIGFTQNLTGCLEAAWCVAFPGC